MLEGLELVATRAAAERLTAADAAVLTDLVAAKAGRTVSVVLPALNEEETVGDIDLLAARRPEQTALVVFEPRESSQ